MVPVSYFEIVSRNDAIQTVPLTSVNPASGEDQTLQQQQIQQQNQLYLETAGSSQRSSSHGGSKSQSPLYGIVMYDFDAERPDELQAKKGESIIVIAQSNEEWFVAKPIGRLGGPGLIPISFVQIRDLSSDQPVTNVEQAIRAAGVPRVEEWKRMAAEYKASSIPLGRFEDDHQQQMAQHMQKLALNETAYPQHQQSQQEQQSYQEQQLEHPSNGSNDGLSRDITTTNNNINNNNNNMPPHHYQQQQQQQQHNSETIDYSNQAVVTSASVDRYAFDGGRYWYLVVAELSNGRYRNLCRYYQDFYDFQIKLLDEFPEEAGRTGKQRSLPFMPGPLTYVNDSISSQRRANLDDYVRNLVSMPNYISESPTVQHLFALRTGDIETPHLTNTMPQPPAHVTGDDSSSNATMVNETHHSSSSVSSTDLHQQPAPQQQQQISHQQQLSSASNSLHNRAASEATVTDHSRNGSASAHSTSLHGQQRSQSSLTNNSSSGTGTGAAAAAAASHVSKPSESYSINGQTDTPGTSPGGKDQFIKVKVFHEDDLIAIRVPASVTFNNLLSRIGERLGLEQVTLLHKDESTGELDQLTDNAEFTRALGSKNKLVLYAK